MNNQQREFGRLTIRVIIRMMKVAGTLEYIGECVQVGRPIPGELIDEFYERSYNAEDALRALRRTVQWRSADVSEDEEDPQD